MRTLLIFCAATFLLLSSFNTRKKIKPKLPEEFARVPGGTFSFGYPDSAKRISVMGFYMSKYEVSNLQYRQFYNEASQGMTDEEKMKIICDTLGWRQVLGYCEPMINHYYQHPAYNNYPVVNISYEGALKYCEWLQQKLQNDNPGFEIIVRLPEKYEWIWAAQGGLSQAMFPWRNYYLRNKKGEPMCNFNKVNDGAIYRDRTTGKPKVAEGVGEYSRPVLYTAKVKSFYPNDYGLYNMCGNAAEMINEKGTAMGGSWNDYGGNVQIRAEAKYERALPTVGFRPVILIKEKRN